MQEVFKNGSEGEVHVEKTLEDLLPHIKKSLQNPKVKYVKVFKALSPITNEESFEAQEEKMETGKDLLDAIDEKE